ncbi:hypothetical protein Hamer_G000980 [Homarus americanus]|uniref:Uncharacterized protein n=1 Tax=Homarus americanus TaxID=6706 RepID=A0A8J5TGE4_HOMAM|nr:hypothetical protein Hamer_G000980 [Homarus americanus]
MSPAIHPVEEPPTFAIPTVMTYEIPKETEFNHAYEVVVALELEYSNIKFSVKPNLVGDLILSSKDHNTAMIFSEVTNLNGKTSTFVWGQQRQKTVNPTPTPPPTVRGFLPCTSPTRLQDKIEDTGTKSVHGGNHDKLVDSTTAAPELCSSKRTEHSSNGGEHHIAWDTATPSGDHPTEYTPACQSTSGIHRRTNKTDDHHCDNDCLYYNKETRYQHRKYNKCSYDTAHRKDAGRPDTQISTLTVQVEQMTPLSQISDKKNLPSQRSLQTVKPQAPCKRSRGTEKQAQTITGKGDSTLKRAEKNSRDSSKNKRNSISCSSLGAGAQETATNDHPIPNG